MRTLLLMLVGGCQLWLAIPNGARAADCVHTVAKGDTLGAIARRHDLTERQLIAQNPALQANPDLIRPGQKLRVCAAPGSQVAGSTRTPSTTSRQGRSCGRGGRIVVHRIRSGDNLAGLAAKYHVDKKAIVARNDALARDPDLMRVGQALDICVGERRPVKNSRACGNRTPLFSHEVVPGEHLGQIAGRYGVRRRDILALNAELRSNPNRLRVGQRLHVCPEIAPRERQRITYTVQSGDTLGSIAVRYGLSPGELERFQEGKLTHRDSLRPGQSLVVWADGGIVRGFGGRDDDTGVLKGGMQLPPGRHYEIKWTSGSWGTSGTVRSIQQAVALYKRRVPNGPRVHVGDISKRSGGRFPPHISHQHGRDVDVGYVLKGSLAHEKRFRSATKQTLDVARTWELVRAFIDTDEVVYIFMDYRVQQMLYEYARKKGLAEDFLDELFQYPRGRGRSHGIIRHWKGHVNHFHVRFRR